MSLLKTKISDFRYDEGNLSILKNIDLEIAQGELVVITGLSGCGKTTLTRILNGMFLFYHFLAACYTKTMTKRILLKLYGEQLQGEFASGFDPARARWIAEQIKPALKTGAEVVIMVGGGNYVRGNQIVGHGIQPVSAHNIGMLSTLMNAIALADVFNDAGLPTRALSTVEINQFIDQYTFRRALSHIEKGRVVIVACGTGRPFLTTDTAALNLALEMQCDVVIKTTKVDGVYDKDPMKFPNAVKFDQLSYQEVLTNPDIAVMDKAAIGLVMDEHIPVIICNLLTNGNIARAARGETVGTLIS